MEQRQTCGYSGSDGFFIRLSNSSQEAGSLWDSSIPGGLGPHTARTQAESTREGPPVQAAQGLGLFPTHGPRVRGAVDLVCGRWA